MKSVFVALIFIGVLIAGQHAHADEKTGACVWPSTNPTAIRVYDMPTANQTAGRTGVLAYLPYRAEMRTGRYIALWSVPETLTDYSQFLGWVDQSQFEVQEPRNCTF